MKNFRRVMKWKKERRKAFKRVEDDTEAMKILKARRESYAPAYVDETELLLLSQHHSELAARRCKAFKGG